jgi:hypothetical protein
MGDVLSGFGSSVRWRTARKAHTCTICKGAIRAGDEYGYWTSYCSVNGWSDDKCCDGCYVEPDDPYIPYDFYAFR